MALVGNVMRGGPQTAPNLPMLTFGGGGDLDLYEADNIATDARGAPLPIIGYYAARADGMTAAPGEPAPAQAHLRRVAERGPWPAGLRSASASSVEARVYAECGARPFDRDPIDLRIVEQARSGSGRIIDSESEVGGYPIRPAATRAFVPSQWDIERMARL